VLSCPSNHLNPREDCSLVDLGCWFVEAGEDGESKGGGREEKNKADLDQQVAHSHVEVTLIYGSVIVVMAATATAAAVAAVMFTPATLEDKVGENKRSKCSEVEDSGEDSSCHKSPLLALAGPAASGQTCKDTSQVVTS